MSLLPGVHVPDISTVKVKGDVIVTRCVNYASYFLQLIQIVMSQLLDIPTVKVRGDVIVTRCVDCTSFHSMYGNCFVS